MRVFSELRGLCYGRLGSKIIITIITITLLLLRVLLLIIIWILVWIAGLSLKCHINPKKKILVTYIIYFQPEIELWDLFSNGEHLLEEYYSNYNCCLVRYIWFEEKVMSCQIQILNLAYLKQKPSYHVRSNINFLTF